MLERQIYGTLSSEQFSTHFGVCCVVTRSIVKPTDANKLEFRQKSHKMLFLAKDCASQGLSYGPLYPKIIYYIWNCSTDSNL